MTVAASKDREPGILNPVGVRALQAASLISLLPLLALAILWFFSPHLPLPYWTAIVSLGLQAIGFWSLCTHAPKWPAFGFAIFLGSLWVVIFGVYAGLFIAFLFRAGSVTYPTWCIFLPVGAAAVSALLLGAHALLAMKVYRSASGGGAHRWKPLAATLGGPICGGLVIIAVWGPYTYWRPGQSPVVGALRAINTAQITYLSTYGSFPPSLAELRPPPQGVPPSPAAAGLIDDALASGTKRFESSRMADDLIDATSFALGRGAKFAYRYDYVAGPRDEHGRIERYTICARPVDTNLGWNNYFTDETGVIRMTEENRCPTPSDFPIAG